MREDLISKNALLEAIEKEREYLVSRGSSGAEHVLVKYVKDIIEDAPIINSYTQEDLDKAYKKGYISGSIQSRLYYENRKAPNDKEVYDNDDISGTK